MAILEKEVWVGINHMNRNYYEELGYEIPRYKDKYKRIKIKRGTKILVKVEHLTDGSNIEVTKICDDCGENVANQSYNNIMKCRKKGDGKDRCHKCSKTWDTRYEKINYEKTLEFYAIENNKKYLLEEFSEKNNKNPNEVFKGSTIKYIWHCKKCNGEYSVSINTRTANETNCPYCAGMKVLKGFNDLWTTHPEAAKFLKNNEIGYEITFGANKKLHFVCDKCNHISYKNLSVVIRDGFSCSKCSDGISYPEKFMISVLDQLNIQYETQKIFEWSKKIYHLNPKFKNLSGMKKYDFYLSSIESIIEVHGNQHYNISFEKMGGRTVDQEIENDDVKMYLAYNNGIKKYIIIDCRYSKLEWIRNSIMNSKLSQLFDLSNIDWLKCHEFACNTLVKKVCDLWNEGIKSTTELSKLIKLSKITIRRYLKQGSKLGWCDYDPKEIRKQVMKLNRKPKKTII